MALVCAVSGEVPEYPVLSLISKHVFERRLLEKYVAEFKKDPICGEPMTLEDIVEIKTSSVTKPRPPTASSIPALLRLLQDEWDSVTLLSHNRSLQVQATRQELSHALYQHDAACRVVARLNKELTTTREALSTMKPIIQSNGSSATVDTTEAKSGKTLKFDGIPDDALVQIQKMATDLISERKKKSKSIPHTLASCEDVSSFSVKTSIGTLHSASNPGITCVDTSESDDGIVITGGVDKSVVVYDTMKQKVSAVLKGHTKRISSVIYHQTVGTVISSAADSHIKIWNVDEQKCIHTIFAHESSVTGISIHPTRQYLISSSSDKHWAFSDIESGKLLYRGISNDLNESELSCVQFHPDGLIFAVGTSSSTTRIWDLKELVNVANIPGHSGRITSVCFSENGYYLATTGEEAAVKLWDLRKLKNFETLALGDGFNPQCVKFDKSGQYLAVGGSSICIYHTKTWKLLKCLQDNSEPISAIQFGVDAKSLFSSSLDRYLRIHASQ